MTFIASQITLLEKLDDLSHEHFSVRNRKLHAFQRRYFRKVIENFQYCQGRVSAYASILPRENVSNSKTTQAAFYVLQEHIFSEINPVYAQPYFFYHSGATNRYVNAMQACPDSQQRKELLMGALLAEALSDNQDITSFFIPPQDKELSSVSDDPLVTARGKYEKLKLAIQQASLLKKEKKSN